MLPLHSSSPSDGNAANASGGSPVYGPDNTPFDAIGGADGVKQLVEQFYDYMDSVQEYADIRGLHPEDLKSSREKLYEFLTGWLGGPPLYINKHGHPRLRARHAPFPIGESERDQWLSCMHQAMDRCNIQGDLRSFLNTRFRHVADFMRNQ